MNEWVGHRNQVDVLPVLIPDKVEAAFRRPDLRGGHSDPGIDLTHLEACTVLMVHGTDDKVVPVEVARDLCRRIPSSSLRELRGRGHYFLYDDGEMEKVLADLTEAHRYCALPVHGAAQLQ